MRNWIFVMALLASTGAPADDEAAKKIREALKTLAPDATVESIEPSPVTGLYEVTVGTQIIYMTPDGRYLMQGSLYDTQTRTDMTSQALSKVRKAALADVDMSQAITFAPPEGKTRHDVTIFTDIDCGYCRRMHAQIQEYNDYGIAVHYMFFPRAGQGSHSFDKAVSVWCADDAQEALTAAKQGVEPEPRTCDNPVADQFQLGQDLGVQGTPAIIAADGTMLPGYMPPQRLVERLDSLAGADRVKDLKAAAGNP